MPEVTRINVTTGEVQTMTITETEDRRRKLGLAETATEAEINAAWDAHVTAIANNTLPETQARLRRQQALTYLANVDFHALLTGNRNASTINQLRAINAEMIQICHALASILRATIQERPT